MSNTERPVIDWLRTIADPVVRESAIKQCTSASDLADSLGDAIDIGLDWSETEESFLYWREIRNRAENEELATIDPTTEHTDWMQEVHQMD